MNHYFFVENGNPPSTQGELLFVVPANTENEARDYFEQYMVQEHGVELDPYYDYDGFSILVKKGE